jgi:hypothetical protein
MCIGGFIMGAVVWKRDAGDGLGNRRLRFRLRVVNSPRLQPQPHRFRLHRPPSLPIRVIREIRGSPGLGLVERWCAMKRAAGTARPYPELSDGVA